MLLQDMAEGRLREVPLLGTAAPLLFPKSERVEQPALGSWVKIRNLGARVVSGQLQVSGWPSGGWVGGRFGQVVESARLDRLPANPHGKCKHPSAPLTPVSTLSASPPAPSAGLRPPQQPLDALAAGGGAAAAAG